MYYLHINLFVQYFFFLLPLKSFEYLSHILMYACDHVSCVQVLVVWDSRISKARNYRLFREVGAQQPAATTAMHSNSACNILLASVFQQEHNIYLDSELPFPDLPTLIEHYHNHPLPHHGSLCLQMPYAHPPSR